MTNQSSVTYPIEELRGRPECGQLSFDSSFAGKIYKDPR
jgi:hypothetical protein